MKRKGVIYFIDGGTCAVDILIFCNGRYLFKGFTKFFKNEIEARAFSNRYTEETEEHTDNYIPRRWWI